MGTGISLVMSCWNRTKLFRLSYPSWLQGNPEYPDRTLPDEILVVNDGGATDLVAAVEDMKRLIEDLGYDIPVFYKHRDKGHAAWSNPAIPHNYLVKEAKGPIVVIIDPETALVNDVLGYMHSYYADEQYIGTEKAALEIRRHNSLAAGTTYAIQSEFQHAGAGMLPHEVPHRSEFVSSDPTSHQVIVRGGPAHECRAWWRDRYIALGGKDESYVAWGYEDLDLEHRNQRFQPKGICGCDEKAIIVTYGHLLPPCTTGSESTGANEVRWRTQSPLDGVANKGVEWGVVK